MKIKMKWKIVIKIWTNSSKKLIQQKLIKIFSICSFKYDVKKKWLENFWFKILLKTKQLNKSHDLDKIYLSIRDRKSALKCTCYCIWKTKLKPSLTTSNLNRLTLAVKKILFYLSLLSSNLSSLIKFLISIFNLTFNFDFNLNFNFWLLKNFYSLNK